jgi:hypothetical protein
MFLDPGATPGPSYPPRKTSVATGQGGGWASWPDLMSPKNLLLAFERRTHQPVANITLYLIYFLVHSALKVLSFMSSCGQLKFSRGITTLLFLFAKSMTFINGFSCHLVTHSENSMNHNVCTEQCTHVTSGQYVGVVLTQSYHKV